MIERLAADLLVLIHLLFLGFVALGGLLVIRWRKLWRLHIPCLVWGVLTAFGGWICPLTPIEQSLRILSGEAGYTGSFIEHYITPLVYPPGLKRPMQITLGVLVLVFNAGLYGWMAYQGRVRTHDH